MRWEKIQVSKKRMEKALYGTKWGDAQELQMKGSNMLFTGAKSFYLGGGWWTIAGYAQDGRDVQQVLDFLNWKKTICG